MPFPLNHKTSKSKLRRRAPSPLDLSTNASSPIAPPLPTPPHTADAIAATGKAFNMFWRKKSSSGASGTASASTSASGSGTGASSSATGRTVEPPKPILKMNTEGQGSANIRFAGAGRHDSNNTNSPVNSPIRANFGGISGGSMNVNEQSTPRIRTHPPAPRVIVSSYDSYTPQQQAPPHHRMSSYDSSPLSTQPRVPSPQRRSSRPTSPSTTSFGTRVRATTEPTVHLYDRSSVSALPPQLPPTAEGFSTLALSTPPMPSHVTTPPTAYVSTFQSRAPPPPSPYRPTNERQRNSFSSSGNRNLPEQLPLINEFDLAFSAASGSLFPSDSRASMQTLPGKDVPMLNIIPATPQDQSDEFPGASKRTSSLGMVGRRGLEEAVKLEDMDEVPLTAIPTAMDVATEIPSIDVKLDFSPFEPLANLPDSDQPLGHEDSLAYAQEVEESSSDHEHDFDGDSFDHEHAPSDPLPPSPPFPSYPSLPSLDSYASMPSSGSEDSMPTSASMSSLVSFPDVEEALGSMLASLSDSSMASTAIKTPTKGQSMSTFSVSAPGGDRHKSQGLGLGLGMDIPDYPTVSSTAPLSPRRRAAPPAPLDLTRTKYDYSDETVCQSAPPVINHRIAFYKAAKAHPNSPSSGIFTSTSSISSSSSSTSTISLHEHSASSSGSASSSTTMGYHKSFRDSISLASEASDEDLCTASIISLTPIMRKGVTSTGSGGVMEEKEVLGEVIDMEQRQGLGLTGLGLGLGLEMGERRVEQEVEVGLAL
ncbi:hypothetical protein IAR55_003414 [Kwoniella newhampshirensis]|uniref:Uncharacterized protein n=1 Tax=Kwoniella newhampshirensis TaxID=1651941 RepID=A0AAW0YZD7_9TREE